MYTSKCIFDRAAEIAELRLETESSGVSRDAGLVKVELDHEQVDLEERVLGIRGTE